MSFLEKSWLKNSPWLLLLVPLSILFQWLTSRRRKKQESNPNRLILSAPVIIVGNVSAGGTGKTPVVMALVTELKARGYTPGVVSRGYGAGERKEPLLVTAEVPVSQSGDEAKLIAQCCEVPVVVDKKRDRAYSYLLRETSVDVVISDDGLQHYNLPRNVEVAVVDGQRMFGNQRVFPSGPLRESPKRLKEVDFILLNGAEALAKESIDSALGELNECAKSLPLELMPSHFVNQVSGEKKPFSGAPFNMGSKPQAVTGLGNPERFFLLLEQLPYLIERHPFPDHYSFSKSDFENLKLDEHQPVVMTEKDAIKCTGFAKPNFWTLKVDLRLPAGFVDELIEKLNTAAQR